MLPITQNGIAVANALVREINLGRMVRTRPRRDHDVLTAQVNRLAGRRLYFQRIRIQELRFAEEHRDAIAFIEPAPTRHLRFDHLGRRGEQLRIGELRGVAKFTEQRIATQVMQGFDGVSQGLAGNGAPMSAAAADFEIPLDYRHAAMTLRRRQSRAFTRRAAADYHYIELFSRHFPIQASKRVAEARIIPDSLSLNNSRRPVRESPLLLPHPCKLQARISARVALMLEFVWGFYERCFYTKCSFTEAVNSVLCPSPSVSDGPFSPTVTKPLGLDLNKGDP